MATIEPLHTYETPEGFEKLVEEYDEDCAHEINAELREVTYYMISCDSCEFLTGNFKNQILNQQFAESHEFLHPGHKVNIASVKHLHYNKKEN